MTMDLRVARIPWSRVEWPMMRGRVRDKLAMGTSSDDIHAPVLP